MKVAFLLVLLFISAHAKLSHRRNAGPKPEPQEDTKNNEKRQLVFGGSPTPTPTQLGLYNNLDPNSFGGFYSPGSGSGFPGFGGNSNPGIFTSSRPISVYGNNFQPVPRPFPGGVVIGNPNLGIGQNRPIVIVPTNDGRGFGYQRPYFPYNNFGGGYYPAGIGFQGQGLGFIPSGHGGGIGNSFFPGAQGTIGTGLGNPGYTIVSANDPRILYNQGFGGNNFGTRTRGVITRLDDRRREFDRGGRSSD